jgi:Tfp pilus assembly protein PilX
MNNRPSFSKTVRRTRRQNQQGVTLITTLLLLMLLIGMSLTMVLAVSSESLINGYYGRYRGSFYAADSGVAAARQQLMNSLQSLVTVGFNANVSPIANLVTAGSGAVTTLTNSYGGYTNVNTAGSWQERFLVKNAAVGAFPTTAVPTCTVSGGEPNATCANPIPIPAQSASYPPISSYNYIFPYTMTVVGQSQGSEVATITDSGTIFVTAPTAPPSYPQSFAAWGMFIGTYALCSSDLVPGTITGPVFTNGSWNFGNSGPYTFTDPVGQSGTLAGWDNGSTCSQSAVATNGIHPTFSGGFNVNQSAVTLPSNSFNQEQAVLDGIGITTTAPTSTQLNAQLKNAAGTAYPTGTPSNGVYLPYSVSGSPAVKTFNGGGIFVQGDAKIQLSPGTGAAQVYTITQSPGGVTTVTIDPNAGSAGTTIIQNGASTQTINGVPEQFSSAGVAQGDATMLFVNGNITGLSGPGQGQPAIQNGTAMTIVASGNNNITITGDILYKTEPVTMTGSPTSTPPIDSLVTANNTGQVLGIYTSGGNVQLANTQSNTNLEIDASIATISATGSGGIVNTGNSIGTLTIVGGRIQNTIQSIGATTRNVLFDRRFQNGFAPPWFPATTIVPKAGVGGAAVVTWKGTQWLNQTNTQ